MRTIGYIVLVVAAVIFGGQVEAGFVIQADYTVCDGPVPQTARVLTLLDGRMAKLDTTELTGYPSALIYSRDVGTIWQVRYADKTYVKIDADQLSSVQRGLTGTADFIQSHLDSYDIQLFEREENKQQRFQMQQTGREKTINGMTCRLVYVLVDGKKAQELWYAPWDVAGLRKSDLIGLIELGKLYEQIWDIPGMNGLSSSLLRVPLHGILNATGYPVYIRSFEQGQLMLEISLAKPRKASLNPAAFSVPAGFKRTRIPL